MSHLLRGDTSTLTTVVILSLLISVMLTSAGEAYEGIVCPKITEPLRAPEWTMKHTFETAFERAREWVVSVGAGEVVKKTRAHGFSEKWVFEAKSVGSGIIWGKEGYILTNAHIIKGQPNIRGRTFDGYRFPLEVVGIDERLDVALLRPSEASILKAPSACYWMGKPRPGMWVAAVGHPYGMPYSLTTGAVSAIYRGEYLKEWSGAFPGFIQSDLSLNRGNSGGPLILSNGVMIGMNTAIHGGASGMAFSLPMSRLLPVIEQLKTQGQFKRSYVGMTLAKVSWKRSKMVQLKPKRGVRVRRVVLGGPASLAGLQSNDLILSVNGEETNRHRELSWHLISAKPGEPLLVELLRPSDPPQIMFTLLIPIQK